MDGHDPYVGAQSAAVAALGNSPRGIGQGGIGVTKGRVYRGHIVVSGDASARCRWRSSGAQAQAMGRSLRSPRSDSDWRSVSFEFDPAADSTDAHFEITGTGTGEFRVGAVSLMPADNINGWRADTTQICGLSTQAYGDCREAISSRIGIGMALSVRATNARQCSIRMECDAAQRSGHGRVYGAHPNHWC